MQLCKSPRNNNLTTVDTFHSSKGLNTQNRVDPGFVKSNKLNNLYGLQNMLRAHQSHFWYIQPTGPVSSLWGTGNVVLLEPSCARNTRFTSAVFRQCLEDYAVLGIELESSTWKNIWQHQYYVHSIPEILGKIRDESPSLMILITSTASHHPLLLSDGRWIHSSPLLWTQTPPILCPTHMATNGFLLGPSI